MASDLFKKYIWLIDIVHRHGPLTFTEINRRWYQSTLCNGSNIALRTFHNHRKAVEELFNIRIACDEKTNRYYIENGSELGKNSVASWLLNSFSTGNLLHESQSIAERVMVEDIPSAQSFLTDLLEAMCENRRVKITYQPFYGDEPFGLVLQPLFVKLYERRWYLYADKPADAKIKLYALDRMQSVAITDEQFMFPDGFSPSEYLAGAFGVAVYNDIKPCTIRIRAYGDAVKYLRTLSLHASQTEVETGADSSVFAYYVAPTHEFYRAVLAYHRQIEVLSPEDVRVEIWNYLTDMANLYYQPE